MVSRLIMVGASALVLIGSGYAFDNAAVDDGKSEVPVKAATESSLDAPAASPAASELQNDIAPDAAATEQLSLADTASQGGVLLGKVSPDAVAIEFDGQDIDIADDGSFLLGFNRDAANQALLRVTFSSGRVESRTLIVNPRKWNIERVNLPRRKRTASAAFQKRRAPELEKIVAARAFQSDSQGWRQQFIWPATGRISGRFGNQRIYAGVPGGYHTGVDIARANGTPIVAPADGVVTLAARKPFSLEGHLLMLDHGMGLNSAFLHLSKIAVNEGDSVKKGQYIGNIGSTGSATGPHLHWSMKWNAARLDPMLLTGPMPQ